MGNKVLLTGGAGYIGSHVNLLLRSRGIETVVLDNLSTGHAESLLGGDCVRGDLRDRSVLDALFADGSIRAVMHFSACSVVAESVRDPLKYYDNNVRGSLALLEAMVDHGVRYLVFSSTAAVYGDPEAIPIHEEAPLRPGNPYGRSKRMVETLLEETARAHDLHFAALRYFNAAGADPEARIGEDHDPETHLIPLVIQTLLGRRQGLSIFGEDYPTRDGTAVRDYVHVMDLAAAHGLCLDGLLAERCEGVFNLGNEQGFSVREVIERAQEIFEVRTPVASAPRRPGDPAVLVASSRRIREELGWEAALSDLDTILRTAWRWHRSRPQGFAGPVLK